jgi:hypothetical protein
MSQGRNRFKESKRRRTVTERRSDLGLRKAKTTDVV